MTQGMTLDMSSGGGGQEVSALGADHLPTPAAMGVEGVVSSDPSTVNAITANALADDDEPEDAVITPPPDGSVELLAGFVDEHGVRHTDVEIRELRGRDEETLARAAAAADTGRFIDTICRVGVIRIGDIEDEAGLKKALDTLLLGDRALLCMEIRRLAYGDVIELDVRCPLCDHVGETDYSFSQDVPRKAFGVEIADPHDIKAAPVAVDDLAQREYQLTCPSGAVVNIRSIDGTAQKKVYTPENLRRKTSEECNTLLLVELISTINGAPLRGDRVIQDQTSRDRRYLLSWVTASSNFGPQYDKVEAECSECLRTFPVGVVDLYQMFRGA